MPLLVEGLTGGQGSDRSILNRIRLIVVEHVLLNFEHDIRDVLPFCEAVARIRELLSETGSGEYVEDDMAIDGGDAEALLRGPSADALFETICPILKELSFLQGATVTLVYGSLGAGSLETTSKLED